MLELPFINLINLCISGHEIISHINVNSACEISKSSMSVWLSTRNHVQETGLYRILHLREYILFFFRYNDERIKCSHPPVISDRCTVLSIWKTNAVEYIVISDTLKVRRYITNTNRQFCPSKYSNRFIFASNRCQWKNHRRCCSFVPRKSNMQRSQIRYVN